MQREENMLVYWHRFSKQNRKSTPSNDVFQQKKNLEKKSVQMDNL